MLGTNCAYLEPQLPHISKIARTSLAETLEGADILVGGQHWREFSEDLQHLAGTKVPDLVGLDFPAVISDHRLCRGMTW